jgi:hypothetical protein
LRLLFYISGHGFGHAARDCEVLNALRLVDRGATVALRTAVPRSFLERSLDAPVEIIDGETDTGVVQPDSLSVDEENTARHAADFYATFAARIAREGEIIRKFGATIVAGDIPPLAFAAAAVAGVPSVAIGNFTWDWIYAAYPQFQELAPAAIGSIADANAHATLALRLPFAGGFASMRRIEDVPLVARRATISREETRRRLQLRGEQPIVLATFGGHKSGFPLERVACDGFTLIASDYEVEGPLASDTNLRVVPAKALRDAGLTYTDLLAAADVAATKLGYGVVSECLANDVALLYTDRGRFVEQEVFMREMPGVMRSLHIDRHDLRRGQWANSVHELLGQPRPATKLRVDGAQVVAERLAAFASSC